MSAEDYLFCLVKKKRKKMSIGTATHCIIHCRRKREKRRRRMIFYLFILSSDIVILVVIVYSLKVCVSRLFEPNSQLIFPLKQLENGRTCLQTYIYVCKCSLHCSLESHVHMGGSVEDERSKEQACFRACKSIIAS